MDIFQELDYRIYNLPNHRNMSIEMLNDLNVCARSFNNENIVLGKSIYQKYRSEILRICGSICVKRIDNLIAQI